MAKIEVSLGHTQRVLMTEEKDTTVSPVNPYIHAFQTSAVPESIFCVFEGVCVGFFGCGFFAGGFGGGGGVMREVKGHEGLGWGWGRGEGGGGGIC